jgi:hypothetical protein
MKGLTMKIETVEDLEAIVTKQNAAIEALGEFVKAMDRKLRLQQALLDNHHEVFVKSGLATPRPAEDPVVH